MLTEKQKTDILQLIREEVKAMSDCASGLGGASAVARKCKVSEGAVSSILSGTYKAKGDDMLIKMASSLGFDFGSIPWNIANTGNYIDVVDALNDAKNESWMAAISAPAGSGKTAASTKYYRDNKHICVYKVDCHVWAERPFLIAVAQAIGAELPKGYANVTSLYTVIKKKFANEVTKRPLLIIDQANSLKPSAMLSLTFIFNDNEDKMGIVALGTENLEYEMKRSVRLIRNGFDELDSRFSRTYLRLKPVTLDDARKICTANGLTDTIAQKEIFNQIAVRPNVDASIKCIPDMRPLVRKIKARRL